MDEPKKTRAQKLAEVRLLANLAEQERWLREMELKKEVFLLVELLDYVGLVFSHVNLDKLEVLV